MFESELFLNQIIQEVSSIFINKFLDKFAPFFKIYIYYFDRFIFVSAARSIRICFA